MAALAGQRTFGEIQGDVAAILGDGFSFSTSSYPTLAQAKQIINRHYKRFVAKRPWKWTQKSTTFPTVAGTVQYTMADAVAQEITLRIANIGVPLTKMSREKFLQEVPGGWTNTGSGTPILYIPSAAATNNALQFDLWPTPDAVYTVSLDYRTRFTALSGDSDYSIVPPEYEDVLVYGPAAEILLMLGDDRAAAFEQASARVAQMAWLEDEQELDQLNQLRAPGVMQQGYPGLIHPYWSY